MPARSTLNDERLAAARYDLPTQAPARGRGGAAFYGGLAGLVHLARPSPCTRALPAASQLHPRTPRGAGESRHRPGGRACSPSSTTGGTGSTSLPTLSSAALARSDQRHPRSAGDGIRRARPARGRPQGVPWRVAVDEPNHGLVAQAGRCWARTWDRGGADPRAGSAAAGRPPDRPRPVRGAQGAHGRRVARHPCAMLVFGGPRTTARLINSGEAWPYCGTKRQRQQWEAAVPAARPFRPPWWRSSSLVRRFQGPIRYPKRSPQISRPEVAPGDRVLPARRLGEPRRERLRRPRPSCGSNRATNRRLSFGYDIRFCVGAPLSRRRRARPALIELMKRRPTATSDAAEDGLEVEQLEIGMRKLGASLPRAPPSTTTDTRSERR